MGGVVRFLFQVVKEVYCEIFFLRTEKKRDNNLKNGKHFYEEEKEKKKKIKVVESFEKLENRNKWLIVKRSEKFLFLLNCY